MSNEPTLKHVSMWMKGRGWTHITPEQVEYGHTIPANYELFLCECCNQYVSFVNSEEQAPHFRHPPRSKDCEEKLSQDSFYNENRLGFSLPLKISNPEGLFSGCALKLEIGFLPLPATRLSLAQSQQAKLRISIKNSEKALYLNISKENFSTECLTYYPISNHVAENYLLHYENISAELFNAIWPPLVRGISSTGTLFDYHTGKRLPEKPFVTVKRPYFLISSFLYKNEWTKRRSIVKDSAGKTWYVYKLQADSFTREADKFFRQFGAQLSDEVSELIPLWPVSTFSSHVMRIPYDRFGAHKLLFYMSGNNVLETNNVENYLSISAATSSPHRGKLRWFNASERQAILTMSRFENHKRVLRYIVVQKKDGTSTNTQTENVRVTDYNDRLILGDTFNQLPLNRTIYICSEVDGFVETRKKGEVASRVALLAGVKTEIAVNWGFEVNIYDGLDMIRCLRYLKDKLETLKTNDRDLLQRLIEVQTGKQVPISHRLGGVVLLLRQYPLTRLWLRKQLQKGSISSDAFQILRRLLRR